MSLIAISLSSHLSIASFNIQTGEISLTSLPCDSSTSNGVTQLQHTDTDARVSSLIISQMDAHAHILTLLIPSKLPYQYKTLLQQYCADNDIDFCVLPMTQYARKFGMQQVVIVEEMLRKRGDLRHSEESVNDSSISTPHPSPKSLLNAQWRHHMHELKSEGRLLEVFGALVGYIAENGIYISAEDNDPDNDESVDGMQRPQPHHDFVDDMVIGVSSIRSVVCVSSQHLMHMDRATFDSLSIFKVEQHPCLTMKIGAPKEALSLFNVLDHTCTSMGRDLLRDWMRKPTTDVPMLEMRHEAIDFFVSGDFLHSNSDLVPHLKAIKDLKRIVHRMHVGKSTVRDWCNLQHSLESFDKVYEVLDAVGGQGANETERDSTEHRPALSQLPKLFQIHTSPNEAASSAALTEMREDIASCIHLLSKAIDWQQSKEQRRLVIRPLVDDELDELKSIYDGLDTLLNRVAQQEILSLPQEFTTIACAYFPQIGFLIQVPRTHPEMDDHAHELHPSLEYRFKTDESYYYKNRSMVELDTSIGDIHGCIMDKEEEVVREIEQYLLEHEGIFAVITDLVARIDCVLSLAVVAREYNLVRPKLYADRSILSMRGGRNLLLEQSVQQLIPNDVYSNEHSRRLHIITGANGSGKSVYLRQVGLTVYMAHIGCFLPCEEAHVGMVDRIMTRIQSQDSVKSGKSSFSSDLQQINAMLQSYTRHSLLLLDEFGKGTLALDGISLMGAVLNYFVDEARQGDCPRMFVTTHYTELFEYDIIPVDNILVQLMKTEVVIGRDNSSGGEVAESDFTPESRLPTAQPPLIYLYKVVPCATHSSSHGIACAQSVGIPLEILDRAREIMPKLQNGEFIAPLDNNRLRSEEECIQIIRRFLRVNLDDDHEVELFLGSMKGAEQQEAAEDEMEVKESAVEKEMGQEE